MKKKLLSRRDESHLAQSLIDRERFLKMILLFYNISIGLLKWQFSFVLFWPLNRCRWFFHTHRSCWQRHSRSTWCSRENPREGRTFEGCVNHPSHHQNDLLFGIIRITIFNEYYSYIYMWQLWPLESSHTNTIIKIVVSTLLSIIGHKHPHHLDNLHPHFHVYLCPARLSLHLM